MDLFPPRPTARLCAALLLLFALVPAGGRAQAPTRQASVGIWPWLTSTDVDADAPTLLANLATRGYDAVYLHVFSSTGVGTGDLRIDDETGGWDPSWGSVRPLVNLSRFTELARAHNLRVFGVLNCFYEVTPTPDSATHRDYLAYDVIDYLLNSFDNSGRDVYGLDGIVLDRVRYYGGNHTRDNVTDFITKVRQVAGCKEVHAYLPANAYILDGPTYDAHFNSYTAVIAQIEREFGLHYPTVAPLLDVMLPMAYTADGHVYGSNYAQMEAYVATVTRYVATAALLGGASARVVPALRAWNDSSGTTTPASLAACARGALGQGGAGFQIFRYYTAFGQPSWWSALDPFVVPGPNAPALRASVQVDGISATFDVHTTSDFDEPLANLHFEVDLGCDGVPELLAVGPQIPPLLLPGPGLHSVGIAVHDSTGLRDTLFLQVRAGTTLGVSTPLVFASRLAPIDFRFQGGAAAAGRICLFLPSLSGASPGTPFGGFTLPVQWDLLTQIALANLNVPPFLGFYGVADPTGAATATLALPPGSVPPEMFGARVVVGCLGLDPNFGAPSFVSNPTGFVIFP